MTPNLQPVPTPCKIIAFPLVRRVGKVRDVARKMLTKSTVRHMDSYCEQVTGVLINQMDRLGVPEAEQDEQLGLFWLAVEREAYLNLNRDGRPGGDAA